ncbi:MAG TPA: hypothetical protein VG871_09760 [Vicinamibacterales bacterium]|nr:hypothetical protein [Vicinamibacterales bacterium]
MKPEEYTERALECEGWPITVTTYRLGDRYFCTVSDPDSGARSARANGSSREEAERPALERVAQNLSMTRRFTPRVAPP